MLLEPTRKHLRRRPLLVVCAGAVVIVGLAVHFLAAGTVGELAADALYAVLIYLIVAFIAPRAHPGLVTIIALGVCALIELFQLTDVPRMLADAFAPARLVLGTTFAPLDLIAYAVGAAIAGAVDLLVQRALKPTTA